MIDTFTLKNGIRAVVRQIDGVKSCSVGVFVKAGSSDETVSENGISHFIEHTNFKGTNKRDTYKISWDSDSLGIILNAATAKEFTYYYTKTISEHVEEAFDILADLFIDSVYPPSELDKERGVVIEEINMYEDTPDDVVTTELISAYYGMGDGFGRTILGPKENVNRFTREDIFAYKAKYYTTDNVVLSFVGDIAPEKARELTEKYFSVLKPSKSAPRLKKNLTPVFDRTERIKDIEQAHLALGFKGVGQKDEQYNYFEVMANILGGGMSSRLFRKIREEMGLCYTVYAYHLSYFNSGLVCVYAGLNGDKLSQAYSAIMKEIELFKKSGVGEDEFNLVREQLKSSLVFAEESTTAQMTLFGRRMLFFNDVYDFEEKLNKINALSVDKLNDYVKNVFDIDKFSVSTVAKKPKIVT